MKSDNQETDQGGRDGIWMRIVYTAVFAVALNLVELILALVVIIQLISKGVTSSTIPELSKFGRALGDYARDIIHYVTFQTEKVPYPFVLPWPGTAREATV